MEDPKACRTCGDRKSGVILQRAAAEMSLYTEVLGGEEIHMKLRIKRLLLTIAGILLVSSLCAVDTRADVLYEPNDDFFEKHRDECSYEDRDYFTDGPDGEVILYESPQSERETGRIPNGERLHLYWLYMDSSGGVWALVDRKQDPKSGELMSGRCCGDGRQYCFTDTDEEVGDRVKRPC